MLRFFYGRNRGSFSHQKVECPHLDLDERCVTLAQEEPVNQDGFPQSSSSATPKCALISWTRIELSRARISSVVVESLRGGVSPTCLDWPRASEPPGSVERSM